MLRDFLTGGDMIETRYLLQEASNRRKRTLTVSHLLWQPKPLKHP
jgi:hypothetical protein